MAESVVELSEKQFDEFTKKGLVFVDFFAEWCMPCVMMAPIIEELSETFKGKIKFGKVNVGDNESLGRKFDISSIPNFILFKDGKVIENFVGAMDSEELENKLKKFV
jgi:thioredoxin 1